MPPVINRRSIGGANEKGQTGATDATAALAGALRETQLTIIALGPLTNIAALLTEKPELAMNIKSIVAVAGNRSGQRRFFLGNNRPDPLSRPQF